MTKEADKNCRLFRMLFFNRVYRWELEKSKILTRHDPRSKRNQWKSKHSKCQWSWGGSVGGWGWCSVFYEVF